MMVKKQEAFEEREITVFSSHMRQSVREEVHDNIKTLSTLKKQGKRLGRLKFLSRCKYGSIEAGRDNVPNSLQQAVRARV
ncbi:MAG: hypothetical protein LBO67_07450 [Spirochaetaceae bacterium]|jgi:hypothetical protein|nr:hypothetical protein [Spirochaetaceae bacterium]